jgi:hypothetical protein
MKNIRMYQSILILLTASAFVSCHMGIEPDFGGDDYGISNMRLDKSTLQLDIGQIGLLALTFNPSDLQQDAPVTWSYDPSVIEARCDNYTAVITALRQGTTTLTATMNSISASCSVTVSNKVLARSVDFPYIYSNTDCLQIAPGNTERVSVSLFGGAGADVPGFTFSIDKPNVASLVSEGNYCWITGQSSGIAKITVYHSRSAYPYSFLVSCQPDGTKIPYLTSDTNIVSINKSENDEATLYVDLVDHDSPSYESQLAYALVDPAGLPITAPPVSLTANGRQLTLKAFSSGECQISVSHPAAPYPFTILVSVTETIENVYIEPSSPVVYVSGDASQILSVSLVGVPPKVSAETSDFSWQFEAGYDQIIDTIVYGSGVQGSGDTVWITGKKTGTVRAAVSHPLAAAPREVFIIVKDIKAQAAMAGFYITTSQNYIATKAGSGPTTIAVYINNALRGDENGLHWAVLNEAADNSRNPVVSWDFGTGTHSAVSRQAVALPENQMVAGNAVISPLRPGRATITISHSKAVYDTVIIVTVKAENEIITKPLLAIASSSPSLTLQNGASTVIAVTLSGDAYEPGDEDLLYWSVSSDNLSVAANGPTASLEAIGNSLSVEYITVSHEKSPTPLSIPVVCYNTAAELNEFKYLIADNPYHSLFQGQTVVLSVTGRNVLSTDTVDWQVSGGQYLVSINQIDKTSVAVTASYPGIAVITAKTAGSPREAAFYLIISTPSRADDPPPAYLTTGQNVVAMAAGEEYTVYVTPVGIPPDQYGGITWHNDNPSALEVIPNGDTASFRALAQTGKAAVTVSSPYSSNSLTIHAHIGDQYEYKNPDHVYISTTLDTITLQTGMADAMLQAVLAHSNSAELGASGFSFSIANPAVASIVQAGNTVFVTPVSTGNTTLTVSNPAALYPKEILVIVEKESGSSAPSPYITTSTNVITVIAGENIPAAVSLANYSGSDTSGWTWASENSAVAAPTANNGTTAMIRGYSPGTTCISVSNAKAVRPLKLIVICLDAAVAKQNPWIKTNTNILNLRLNSSSTVTAEMIGGVPEDNSGFIWSVNDGSFALLSGSGQSVSVKGLREGTTYITVRNTGHNASYSKTILVIVDKALAAENYIVLNNNVIRLKPDAAASETIRAGLSGGSVTDPQDFLWWADDYKLVHLDSVTDTAQVRPLGFSGVTYVHVKHPKARDVLDILVIISNFDQFAFSLRSKTISQEQIFFVPLEVPPSIEKTSVKYTSYDDSVCTVTGSSRVAMIAGIKPGQTTVKAELSNSAGVIASAELAVIVRYQDPASNRITAKTGIINLKDRESLTVQAALEGSGISPGDEHQITWKTSDSSILSLLSSPGGEIRGNSAYVTARNPGKTSVEAVLTASHPKCESDLNIWVLIPGTVDIALVLDQTRLEIYKEEGSVSVSATLVNAGNNEYNNIHWTAPKSGGEVIINITRAKGKTCNIVPRAAGQTTLRAQLPNGVYADCIIIVKNYAELVFETKNVRVAPGFSETVSYSVTPQNAGVYWICQYNGGNGEVFFDYAVDEAAKTITVTGREVGAGSVTGYFAASSGGVVKDLNVRVEHTYDLTINAPLQIKLQPDEKVYKLPFTVYPKAMNIEAFSSNNGKLQIRSVSLDTRTGNGEIEVVPSGEELNVTLTVKASNPKDPVNGVITRDRLFHVYYDNIEFDFEFDYRAGAFTYFNPGEGNNGTLHLGDGETATFRINTPQKNLDISNINVSFSSPLSGSTPHARLQQGDNGGYISLVRDPPGNNNYWSIRHLNDTFTGVGYKVYYKLQAKYTVHEWQDRAQKLRQYDSAYETRAFFKVWWEYQGVAEQSGWDDVLPEYFKSSSYPYTFYDIAQVYSQSNSSYGPDDPEFTHTPVPFNNGQSYTLKTPDPPAGYEEVEKTARISGSGVPHNISWAITTRYIREVEFRYVPVTPYIVYDLDVNNVLNILNQNYHISYLYGFIGISSLTYTYTGSLYDTGLLEYFIDNNPAIDTRYQAALNVTYTRALDGKSYSYVVPVYIEERSCPAYLKQ